LTEPTETVVLTLANKPNYARGTPFSGTASIADSPTYVSVVASDPVGSERGVFEAPDPATFTFSRQGGLDKALTSPHVVGGTARPGIDYQAPLTGSVTLAPGQASATIQLDVVNNSIHDGTRTASITLQAGSGYVLDVSSSTATILDNDGTPVVGPHIVA